MAQQLGGARREAEEMDEGSEEMAFSEIKRLNGQFDLMVVYLPGLDHLIHGVGGPLQTSRSYFNEYLHGTINRIYKELGPVRDTTVFGVVSDHGHYDTDLNRAIDFTEQGSEVLTGKTMHEVPAGAHGYSRAEGSRGARERRVQRAVRYRARLRRGNACG